MTSNAGSTLPDVAGMVLLIRGQRVLIAQQLASLYGVEPRVLMQQVQRNAARFPADFMFQLDADEFANLKSQFVTSSWGGIRKLPCAFTEQGVAMLSSVLRSERAVAVNIEIMRAFVKLRGMLAEHADLKKQLAQLEEKYDGQFRVVFDAIHRLMEKPARGGYDSHQIGFAKDK
ncbi:MAG: ORF6N domain-containing protein [Desulfobulbus sp.]|nr:ORF6N domain-containing protein [Desulfobulbus sp.]